MPDTNRNMTASYAAHSAGAALAPLTIERREVGPKDVQIDIEYCGVCHTDLHFVNDDWGMTAFPVVPGHEIVGRVSALGDGVSDLEIGQRVAIGCIVDSCRSCSSCEQDLEQYCRTGMTMTYNSTSPDPGGVTYGGYSRRIVADRHYILTVPENLAPEATAPLLCAGITSYSPLAQWKVGPGMKVGVIGLGGLGHMGIKFAHAMGAEVVMITTSPGKAADGKRLGADSVLVSTDEGAMEAAAGSFDFLLNTIPVPHDFNPYIALLKVDATMCVVGALDPEASLNTMALIMGRRRVAGSLIGGIAETQEMLDFCGKHDITSDVEVIAMADIDGAYARMKKSDVKYRFVIDLATLDADAA